MRIAFCECNYLHVYETLKSLEIVFQVFKDLIVLAAVFYSDATKYKHNNYKLIYSADYRALLFIRVAGIL